MRFVVTDGNDLKFMELCEQLDQNLNEIVGGEKQREEYKQYNLLTDIHDVILAYDEDDLVGCGAYKHYEEGVVELKRVFVKKEHRGKGIAEGLVKELMERAASQDYHDMILETGRPLIAAQKLYKRLGFQIIANYGQYQCMGESVCMKKTLQET